MFVLNPCQFEARITVAITLLLTLVSLHNNVQEHLPDVPYTTRLDVYIRMCYSLLYLTTILICVLNHLFETNECCDTEKVQALDCPVGIKDREIDLRYIEAGVVGVLALVWLIFNFFNFVQIRWFRMSESDIFPSFMDQGKHVHSRSPVILHECVAMGRKASRKDDCDAWREVFSAGQLVAGMRIFQGSEQAFKLSGSASESKALDHKVNREIERPKQASVTCSSPNVTSARPVSVQPALAHFGRTRRVHAAAAQRRLEQRPAAHIAAEAHPVCHSRVDVISMASRARALWE